MDLLDLLILVFAISAVVGGYRLGFVARATSWIGLILGLVIAAHFLPDIVDALRNSPSGNKLLIVAATLIGAGFVGQALGLLIGASFHSKIPTGTLRQTDRVAGAVAGGIGVIAAVWLLLPAMSDVQGWASQQSRNSAIARAIDSTFPRPPDTLQALRRLVGSTDFPRVFDALKPAQDTGSPPDAIPLSLPVQQRVSASTVKVEGIACRRIQDGSGFTPQPDVIVTNAHVVAGERSTSVITPNGRRLKATVVLFDPNRDLALLRVPGLGEAPLPVATAKVGTQGAVFGHPNGQDNLAIQAAAIRQQVTAVGRDLYDSHETRRQVFILASALEPGDSGGALVNPVGSVVGVAFAIAPDRPGTAYALTTDELRPVLAAGGAAAVNTGPCLSEP
ncbi:MAG: MarP family serine protease [Acidimicrobiia bacterium]|nr:MarP family serine protease [Acidimicrobiia bacterium]MBV9284531.1 MarP family serine protease [Acidimicrobiia bacterium]